MDFEVVFHRLAQAIDQIVSAEDYGYLEMLPVVGLRDHQGIW